jgi:hypothetical protein
VSSKIYGSCKGELKAYDLFQSATNFQAVDTTAAVSLVAGIVQGTADGQRVGREIRVKKIEYRLQVRDPGSLPIGIFPIGTYDDGYRIDIVRDTQNNKQLINAAGQLKDSDYMGGAVVDKMIGQPIVAMKERVKILRSHRKWIRNQIWYGAANTAATALANCYHHNGTIRFPGAGLKILYAGITGTGTDLPSDDIRVYLPCTSSVVANCTVTGYYRVWYTDD